MLGIGLTTGELTEMRAVADASMPDTAIIYPRVLVEDSKGGKTATWAAESDTVACRLSFGAQPGSADSVNGGKVDPAQQFILSLPYETAIAEYDRAKVGEVTYEVISIVTPRSYEVSRRLLVKRV